jgi:hypothetical protein
VEDSCTSDLLEDWCQGIRQFFGNLRFLTSSDFLRTFIQAKATDVKVIRELLSPWNVSFTGLNEAEVVIVYNKMPLEAKRRIVIPSDSVFFTAWLKDMNLDNMKEFGKRVITNANPMMNLTLAPCIRYRYEGSAISAPEEENTTETMLDSTTAVLKLDVVNEYKGILNRTLNAKQSKLYRLFTGLPVPYSASPKELRDFFMKRLQRYGNVTFCDKLPVDALRFILIRAMERLTGKKVQKKTWKGKTTVYLVTHDIETYDGLQRAKIVKKLEERYNVPSAWYIPSKRYKLNCEIIRELANFGEVGAHDTKHDGKLAQLPTTELLLRLIDAKRSLGKITQQSIDGFRAPLLQHNLQMLKALDEAGYTYDTSIPAWEPKHPYTMKSHGIGTIFPLKINGIVEIPVTLPQDHQMIHCLAMSPGQTVEAWTNLVKEVERIGGLCVFLAHPNELANLKNQSIYEDFLNIISSNNKAPVGLPRTIANDICN